MLATALHLDSYRVNSFRRPGHDEESRTARARRSEIAAGTARRSESTARARAREISFEEAAKLVKRTVREKKKTAEGVVLVEREVSVSAGEIFAVNEYPDRYHVITKDGQKLVAQK
jgi:hypothetical protein